MSAAAPAQLQWQINGLKIAGLSWGEPGSKPLLALHGWLDNAASFSALAPLLEGYYVVAPDLSGHGRSDHRSADASYNIWDDLPELLGVLDNLGWAQFALLGHSRGAAISTLLASSIPERIEHLVLLDGLLPEAVDADLFPTQMRKYLHQKRDLMQRENRVYRSIEAALASREPDSMPEAAVRQLITRNLRPCEGGYTWTTDLRLRGASAVKLGEGNIHGILRALSMPTLLLLADGGFGKRPGIAARARAYIDKVEIGSVAGGHHFHMEPEAAIVAQKITGFLQS